MTSGPALLLGALLAAASATAPPTEAPTAEPPRAPAGAPPAEPPRAPAEAAAPRSEAPKAPAEKPKPTAKGAARRPALPAASLPSLEGEVAAIDHRAHRLSLRTVSGEVVLSFDRDTLVRDATGATTPLRITPGSKVRVGKDGDARAAWVEVSPTPGQSP